MQDNFVIYRDENKKQIGFGGEVTLFGKKVFVDTVNGKGVTDVLDVLKPLGEKYGRQYKIQGYEFDDIKQHVNLMILEGIKNYDASKSALSTFLLGHVYKRMALLLKKNNGVKMRNATFLKYNDDQMECPVCDHQLIKEKKSFRCEDCGGIFSEKTVQYSMYSNKLIYQSSSNAELEDSSGISGDIKMLFSKNDYDLDFVIDFKKSLEILDEDTKQMLYMYVIERRTLEDIGSEFGISKEWVRRKISALKYNKHFCNLLNKQIRNEKRNKCK